MGPDRGIFCHLFGAVTLDAEVLSMATDRQIEANRENSKSSTGPRTAEGKAVVAGNAVKHGLTAATRVVIRDESPDEFARMHAALHAETVTGSELERGLIDEVAAATWRLRRAARIERDMMDEDIRRALWKKRHRARVYDERREEHRLRLVAAGEMDPDEQFDPQPFDPLKKEALLGDQIRVRMLEDDGYAKLGRYEVQLRRGLYQAVRELRMLRAQWAKDSNQSLTRRPAGAGD